MNWEDGDARFFNPSPRISAVPLPGGHQVVILDDVLLDPEGLIAWARGRDFRPPGHFFYPGVIAGAPSGLSARFSDYFADRVRPRLQGRRTLSHAMRLSMVTTPPSELDPRQWQCHRDEVSRDPAIMFAASVLYLFRDPVLGGTSFYVPRQSDADTDRILDDSAALAPAQFSARYGLHASYMDGGNAYFDCVARVPAAWNRMIVYDAGYFHSGDIGRPDLLTSDPATGRLTLNGFFTCRRHAR
jgi:hypothetical protein